MSGNWIIVASADHVRRGKEGRFIQACHGKAAPMRRIKPGDNVICYSPSGEFRGNDKLRAFTAIGIVAAGEPYRFDGGGGFSPYRRDVDWLEAGEAPILPLLEVLEFSAGAPNWGYRLRFGILAISEHDFRAIADAMAATCCYESLHAAT